MILSSNNLKDIGQILTLEERYIQVNISQIMFLTMIDLRRVRYGILLIIHLKLITELVCH